MSVQHLTHMINKFKFKKLRSSESKIGNFKDVFTPSTEMSRQTKSESAEIKRQKCRARTKKPRQFRDPHLQSGLHSPHSLKNIANKLHNSLRMLQAAMWPRSSARRRIRRPDNSLPPLKRSVAQLRSRSENKQAIRQRRLKIPKKPIDVKVSKNCNWKLKMPES